MVLAVLVMACDQRAPRQLALPAAPVDAPTAADAGVTVVHIEDAGPGFQRLAPPEQGDWQALHPEPGQTVAEFVRDRPHQLSRTRRTLYLMFVSGQPRDATPKLTVLASFVRAFFGLPVKLLPATSLKALGLRAPSPARLAAKRLRRRLAAKIPVDAAALLALTDVDLTSDSVGSVFGEASARLRVGVASVARLHLGFYVYGAPSNKKVVLRRSLTLLAHEIGHLLGIEHCTAYRCVMNGVASLRELDNLPAHVCPHDLRKLVLTSEFDERARYRRLAAFYVQHGLNHEAIWADARGRVDDPTGPVGPARP